MNKRKLYESIMRNVSKNVKRTLNESVGDGWDFDGLPELQDVLSSIEQLTYELEKCQRGAYTNCTTYKQLANYIKNLANKLDDAAYDVECHEEED